MEPQVLGPYVISHVVAVIYVFVAWRWPRVARWIAGVGFILAGVFNIWTVSTSPEAYVEGFGRYAIPLYRRFIYGDFARHTGAFVVAIAGGQIAVGALVFAPLPWRRLG